MAERVLYVSDLDGTLLNGRQEIPAQSREVLNALIREGMHFTIATARAYESVKRIVEGLELQVPVVLFNGVFIRDMAEGRYLVENYLDPLLAQEILRAYLDSGLNPLVYTMNAAGEPKVYYRGIFNESEAQYIGNRTAGGDKRFTLVSDFAEIGEEQVITVNAIDRSGRMEAVFQTFRSRDACVCHYGPDVYAPAYHWLEISSLRATKREAVLALKAMGGYDRLVCFGDNLNDLSMFEAADECYAVSNAHPLALDAADGIIASNEENGVAYYLRDRIAAENVSLS
ncbi:HAD family hydrolase [Paenibacillus mucilaginosus]|uniref:Phosphatase n=1 Tax=Paenibacillus mucilaginosus (strain KNP414) TaxID=1036673 RepID=F8FLP5_PAEMK|nr:HAD family hydrolase [Paenibacillus mucilaginosus]AEI44172.1 phosphatase [Paenibacillus mucilaginosus KNP414]MCG7212368.1 HAD family hydrolase [Paenibacillus mucilaginosus]WDM25588.1 HAD family hydrolase [Paenibacillus mucilaginosus]WFA20249.1 HAD family hydrolase [Paenibacillus mucilaginosus]